MPVLYSQFTHEDLIYLDRKQPSKREAIKLLLDKGKSYTKRILIERKKDCLCSQLNLSDIGF
jgi:hypothetical protein